MLAKLQTFSLLGIEALPVEVEVDVSGAALPKTVLVGLPEAAVKESTHRIERALVNSGYVRPADRVVINLAPAELPKQAASFDLPIALGVLAASGQLGFEQLAQYAVVGELALDGGVGGRGRGAGACKPAGVDQPLQGHPGANAARNPVDPGRARLPRHGRHQGPGNRRAGDRDADQVRQKDR